MRVFSRELFVGVLIVCGLAVSGCQPIQPVQATLSVEVTGEPQAISGTESVTNSESVTSSETISALVALPATETVSTTITATPVITASGNAAVEVVAPVDPAVLAAGMAVYRAQYCGVCHTLDAAQTHGTFGPTHNGMGSIAAERILEPTYGGFARDASAYLRESIVEPQVFIVPGYATTSHRMPSYAHIQGDSLDALVAFLLAQ